jgi:hypothetical protein
MAIAGSSEDAPQPEIAVLEVSQFAVAKAAKAAAKAATKQASAQRARTSGNQNAANAKRG